MSILDRFRSFYFNFTPVVFNYVRFDIPAFSYFPFTSILAFAQLMVWQKILLWCGNGREDDIIGSKIDIEE